MRPCFMHVFCEPKQRENFIKTCVLGRLFSSLWPRLTLIHVKRINFTLMVLGWWTVIATFKFMQYTFKAFTRIARSVHLVLFNMMLLFSLISWNLKRSYRENRATWDICIYEISSLFGSTKFVSKILPTISETLCTCGIRIRTALRWEIAYLSN
jgi:hypothetical protein